MPSTSHPAPARVSPSGLHRVAPPAADARPTPPPVRPVFLNNDEAARFLSLSPRTLEKHRVIGGGPRFRKFGRRVVYALTDLEAWANARTCESTSDPQYAAMR
jgi:hypothetical protein